MSEHAGAGNEIARLKEFSNYFIPTDSCNLCGSKTRTQWAVSDPIVAYQCDVCGLVYHDPQLSREGRDAFYARGYFELENNPEDAVFRDKMYEVEIAFLERRTPKGKILDVGCGGGFLLDKFGPAWEKYGLEFDAKAAANARDKFGFDVRQGEVNEHTYPAETFDVIVLRGVIEHMAEPRVMMAHLMPWLKSGGLLYITSTPNAESLCAEVYREKWRLFTSDHQIHFPKRAIVALGKELGLELIDSAYFYLETPYANEVADYRKIIKDMELLSQGKKDSVGSSPAFYGNMLSLLFKKTPH